MSEPTDFAETVSEHQRQLLTSQIQSSVDDSPSYIGRYRVEKLLGEGSFGRVYLAYDEQLQRLVAIKVPHRHRVTTSEEAEAYRTEARTVANLDHPHIVAVYDIGSSSEFPCFIVSKYIDGTSLAAKIEQSRFSVHEAAELVATIAEALHYAHKQGLVHRDIKPGNILIDKSNKPFVVDFGLALREQDLGKGPCYAGTPAYMSPEQARGEGHRVDGRSDIFSLGIVFYYLLTRRRPFHGDSRDELREQITTLEVRPPRQWDEALPREVERICLKALCKRASERYSTAKDMADDLRHFLVVARVEEASAGIGRRANETVPATPLPSPRPTPSETQVFQIIPKGLRSFDAADADFFLELLPGPKDRDGLPESIRFWKDRIERTDSEDIFSVGLIYGPSGCGKSSLVKAGLLPKLAKSVTVAYIEANTADTESHLLKSLRRQVPDLPGDLNLIEALAALRRGRFLGSGQKVLIVLDQFEQWLHAKRNEENTELIQALRHCDGARLQCLIMVRDDFWLAVSRFMKALEVEILEGRNSALVDLFDPIHARKVLIAFGRAYDRLPERSSQFTKEQDAFLKQAVASLAQEGKVISVRLALIAEMVKGKPWTPATLKEVGGTEGVGVTFLEETFAASTAPPQHRLHQKAAQLVLKALLPEGRANIKGHMRSQQELMEISGYADRPQDFAQLMRILDIELRLITPTDPESREDASPSAPSVGQKYYQLTHDYLVPSLRDWLTRKQKETRRGRAEQRLAERVALWQAKSESRQLPSLVEWLEIRLLTNAQSWSGPARQMMRAAARKHLWAASRVAAIVGLLIGLVVFIRRWETEALAADRAKDLVRRLLDVNIAKVPDIIPELDEYRRWTDPELEEVASDPDPARRGQRIRAQLALLPVARRHAETLAPAMLDADSQEFPIIRDALARYATNFSEPLWDLLESATSDPRQRFRAAAALATYDPSNPRWKKSARWVADQLIEQPSLELPRWVEALKPIREDLTPALSARFRDKPTPVAAAVLSEFPAGQPEVLTEALAHATPDTFAVLFSRLVRNKDKAVAAITTALDRLPQAGDGNPNAVAAHRANLAIALLRLGNGERLWPLLKASPDPRCRSFLIDRLAPLGCEPAVLLHRLATEQEKTVQAALLLALGNFDEKGLPPSRRAELVPQIAEIHTKEGSAAVHAAAEWLLGKWNSRGKERLANVGDEDPRHGWYVNGSGMTMIKLAGPVTFQMGAQPNEPGSIDMEKQHWATIDHSYDIGMTEVTVAQYLRFLRDRPDSDKKARQALEKLPPEAPAAGITWYDATAFCNWLSLKEGIPREQWCYEKNAQGKFAEGMKIRADWPSLRGYRLPTEAEWEYACRGRAATSRCYGDAEELLPKYAWYAANAMDSPMPVAQLLPNAVGLFDMHGNTQEWCQDVLQGYTDHKEEPAGAETILSQDYRVNRGGFVLLYPRRIRSAQRFGDRPTMNTTGGFRLARSRP